jgi:hypothetical protein
MARAVLARPPSCWAAIRGVRSAAVPGWEAGLELLPTWALEQNAAANRQIIGVMRSRLAAGEAVARMYREPGLAWLERQAEVTEELITDRRAGDRHL